MKDSPKNLNIINYKQSGAFYYRRALKLLDNGQYLRCIKHLHQALEIVPDNVDYKITLAQTLSEIEYYEDSNDILFSLMIDIDDTPTDCYYGLGCNFYGMNEFGKALAMLNQYVSIDPYGSQCEDAFYIIENMHDILEEYYYNRKDIVKSFYDNAPNIRDINSALLKKDANGWVNEKNSKALFAYMNGDYKSVLKICSSIQKKIPNEINSICAMMLTYYKQKDYNNMKTLSDYAIDIAKNDDIQLHKVAIVLCETHQHDKAVYVLNRLLETNEHNPKYTHYLAIGYYNLHKYDKALKQWRKILNVVNDDIRYTWYYNKCKAKIDGINRKHTDFEYSLYMPNDGIKENLKYIENALSQQKVPNEKLWENKRFRNTVTWGLNLPNIPTAKNLLLLVLLCAGEEREKMFRSYLLRHTKNDEMKKDVLTFLKKIDAREPYLVMNEDSLAEVKVSVMSIKSPSFPENYIKVIEQALSTFGEGELILSQEIVKIWEKYISSLAPDLPRIRNVKLWAAALFYVSKHSLNQEIAIEEIAEKHGISKRTLNIAVKKIIDVIL